MEYYERFRELRLTQKESQATIAKLLNTTQQMYNRYEHGGVEMPVRHIITLCKHFSISADYILGLPQGLPWGR